MFYEELEQNLSGKFHFHKKCTNAAINLHGHFDQIRQGLFLTMGFEKFDPTIFIDHFRCP